MNNPSLKQTLTSYLFSALRHTGVTRLLLLSEYKKRYRRWLKAILLKESADSKATMHIKHAKGYIIMIDFAVKDVDVMKASHNF